MKCAVVSFPKETQGDCGRKWFFWRKNNVFEHEIIHAKYPVTVYILPFTEQEMREKKEKKQRKIFLRCIKELMQRDVRCVYITESVLEIAPLEEFERRFTLPSGKAVFDLLISYAVKLCAENAGLNITEAEVGIWQNCFDEHGICLLERLCTDLKYAALYTNSPEAARAFADKLYLQTGLSLKISTKLSEMNRCDVVVLTQACPERIVREETIIIDESGVYPYRCKNTIEFALPFGFNTLMPYFVTANQRCMEFLLAACGAAVSKTTNLPKEIEAIGCHMKRLIYN